MATPRIVILGAGYGGLMAATTLMRTLEDGEADVWLINKHDYHYMTTHLHEPAAGTAADEKVRVPLRDVLDFDRVHFRQGTVKRFDPAGRIVELEGGETIPFDYLVVALGSEPETFGIEGLREHAFAIRSLNSVRVIREHIEYMFSLYRARGEDPAYTTIVVGGAGFTGIEFVTELAERLPRLARAYDVPEEAVRLVSVEAAPTILPGFDPSLVAYAEAKLREKGIEVHTNTPIKACTPEGVVLQGDREIRAKTVVWTGGVRGNRIVEASGLEVIRGRVKVDPYLRAPGYEHIFVVGDSAVVFGEDGRPYPPTAQIAVQEGRAAALNLAAILRGTPMQPFKPNIQGTLASLGRWEGIGIVGKRRFYGLIASLLKRGSDLRYLWQLGGMPIVLKKIRYFFA
ncbi:MAG: NAD(P)/FAD-dependent oxidoreductase [Hydrogenibacillus schlegelii]|uniref:NAD(P)/FAD-dependent oxidoreductase n=1 Tax=Hydrogenibacillus schlegelii TaxID=1484 RepID=A0A947CVS5_HYDSH|nr:NAD(P)/FAD-dependent oxidoreductase [Hydrogenibacillus schlegelii]